MAFTVEHFHDLVRLLEENPAWRADMRRLLLTEELLALPALVAKLAEAQQRMEARFGRVEDDLDVLKRDVAYLKGSDLERKYAERAPSYFHSLVRRARTLTPHELAVILDDAPESSGLSEYERDDVLLADVVVRGRHRETGRDVHLMVEVSYGIGMDDVERAARCAAALGKLLESIPVVAGQRISPHARERASAVGVAVMLSGPSNTISDDSAATPSPGATPSPDA